MARRNSRGFRRNKHKDLLSSSGTSQKRGGFRKAALNIFKSNPLFQWMKKDWFVIATLVGIFLMAFLLRSYFYYDIAVNPPYENYDFILSGNDPYYHKQVIDHVQNTGGHLYWDNMLNYPVTARNPYPPVYDWSVAVTGMVLGTVTGIGTTDATWFVLLFAPAFWGAMIIFPVYFLTKIIFGKKAGILAAFFMALMPSHIERSPLGFSDHDAIVLFFVVTTFFFLAKSFNALSDKRWIENWRSPRSITIGTKEFLFENKIAMGYALLCGFSIATIALIWKGFPYVMVIITGYYIIQLLFNKFRRVDSFGLFIVIIIVNFTAMMVSFPIAYQLGAGTWYNPFFIVAGIVIIGFSFVPTRDYPWLVVLPGIAITLVGAYLIVNFIFPEQAESLFSGGGYFIKSKLYSTIAEAQAPDLSRLVFSYGPVTFYLALIGLVLAIIAIPKNFTKDYILITIWCALAVYMAISAVRFMFNASPVFAILTGWMVWKVFEKTDPTLRRFKRPEAKMIYLYVGLVTAITLTASFYITYEYVEQYTYFKYLFGLSALGIAMCLAGLYLSFRFNYYFMLILMGGYTAAFLLYSWFRMEEIFYVSLGLLAIVVVPILIFFLFKYTASGVRIELTHIGIAVFITFLILMPNGWFAVDSAIPYESKRDYDPQNKILGAFGHSFVSEYWLDGMNWLSEQDQELQKEDRPGFVSWWDYGFWAIYLGQHPSVAENFQNGYHFAGSVIASQGEDEAITLFSLRLIEGDIRKTGGDKSEPIIIKYLDNGDASDHPNTNRIYDAMRFPTKYMDEVRSNPDIYGRYIELKPENTKYAIGRVLLMNELDMEERVDLLVELEEATGKSIRYFAVDSRLFPFDASNTGIFYAPIKLADRDIDDFLEYYANAEYRLSSTSNEWIEFPDNPLSTDRLEEEIDERGQELIRIMGWELRYTDMFYGSMFYHAYIGWKGEDVGLPNDAIPGMDDGVQTTTTDSFPAMQAWNMTHFKLVYRTLYWNPYNQTTLAKNEEKYSKAWRALSYKEALERKSDLEGDGIDNNENGEVDEDGEGGTVSQGPRSSVYYLKYYPGASVKGYVRTAPDENDPTDTGRPVPDVRVTVLDEYVIPHNVVYTDENGWFNITVPSGDISLVVSNGGLKDIDTNIQLLLLEKEQLNSTRLMITEDQADRKYDNWVVYEDIRIEPGALNGTIYWDKNGNDAFDEPDETPVEEIELILSEKSKTNNPNENLKKQYVLSTKTDSSGFYQFEQVIPGSYQLEAKLVGHNITLSEDIPFKVGERKTNDFGVSLGGVKGIITYFNGTPAAGISINILDETNQKSTELESLPNGTYYFEDLLPGNYSIAVETTGYQKFKGRVLIEEDKTNETDIVLIPITPVSGYVYYDRDSDSVIDSDEKLHNARVTFYHREYPELNSVMFTNSESYFEGNLSAGNYSAYVKYILNNKVLAGLTKVNIKSQTEVQSGLIITVEPATRVSGVLTKLMNVSVPGALIKFTDKQDGGVLPVPTNHTGNYFGYLPEGDYTLKLNYVDFNITYSYVKDFELEDEPFELDFNVIWATPITGRIYWDRNNDGKFTSYWFDGEHEENETHLHDEEEEEAVNETIEDPALVKESLEGVVLRFTSVNGTFSAKSNYTGVYKAYLSPGTYAITMEDLRFFGITDTNPQELLSVKINDTPITHTPTIIRDFKLKPQLVDINGQIWYDANGNDIMNDTEELPGITITFTNQSSGTQMYQVESDSEGKYELTVLPGVYDIEVDSLQENGVRYLLSSENFTVPFRTSDTESQDGIGKDLKVEKYIIVNYTVELAGSFLSDSELQSENLTLHIYNSDEEEVELLPVPEVDLGGYLKPGEYSIWLDYFYEGDFYLYLGQHDVEAETGSFNLPLVKGVRVNGTVYNDTDNFGVIDLQEWLLDIELKFTPEEENGGLIKIDVATGVYSLYVIPDLTYSISVDAVKSEFEDNTEIEAKYIYTDNLKIIDTISYDVEVTRYLNVSGLLFYNVFETEFEQPTTAPGEISDGELGENIGSATITFTELSETGGSTTLIIESNATGSYQVYLKDRVGYNIMIEGDGFETEPVSTKSFIVAAKNTTFNIQAMPSYVTLSGRIYSAEDNRSIPDANLEFILYFNDIGTIYKVDNIEDGYYSIDLIPEHYKIYSYTDARQDKSNLSNIVFRSQTYFGSIDLNISEDKTFDIPMVPGVRLSGSSLFIDSDGNKVSEFNQFAEDGEGIFFEHGPTGGYKNVDIIRGFYDIYLPYGDYSARAELRNFEYGMNMTYTMVETITVDENTTQHIFELEKMADYRFGFLMDQEERTMTVPPGSSTIFYFKLNNAGNSPNLIKFESPNPPSGWTVKFSPESVELPINGEATVQAAVNASKRAYADNTIDFKATAERDSSQTYTETMKMLIPAHHEYEFYTESPESLGINFNETLEVTLTIQNKGNAFDTITIMGPEIPPAWNVTIDDQTLDNPLNFPYAQDDDYKNLTMKIKAPPEDSGHMTGERLTLNLLAHSEKGEKSQSLQLEAVLNLPDLTVVSFDIENLRLDEPDRDNITINATFTSSFSSSENVFAALYIDGEMTTNHTFEKIKGDEKVYALFTYEDAVDNKGDRLVQVYIDPFDTVPEVRNNNNDLGRDVYIGPLKEEEEFNWRPWIALMVFIVIVLGLMGYWRWKRKI